MRLDQEVWRVGALIEPEDTLLDANEDRYNDEEQSAVQFKGFRQNDNLESLKESRLTLQGELLRYTAE